MTRLPAQSAVDSITFMLKSASYAAVLALVAAACSSAGMRPSTQPGPAAPSQAAGNPAGIAQARADSARLPYTKADIDFMSGMIHHHAQAIVMAKWAPTHGASPSVQTLCERIINAQTNEIATMQTWLRDRGQPVPEATASGMPMMMNGSMQNMLMPGMLTADQMKALDAARGVDFDQLFLTDMIQHHKGAVSMVHDLFETQGAGQDEAVFKFASNVNVDQTTEIDRMERMIVAIKLGITQ